MQIALIAHDQKKPEMVEWVREHHAQLKPHRLYATGTTGQLVLSHCPDLDITCLKSGPLGGDQQIGALIATGDVGMMIFFTDPLSPHPHDVDVKALTRLATLYDIPMACNRATADAIMKAMALS